MQIELSEDLIEEIRETIQIEDDELEDIVVDDMNLDEPTFNHLGQLASQFKAVVEVLDFRDVPLETCLARDKKRPNYVGEKVITDTWKKYIRKANPAVYHPRNYKLPSAVIVDIDGTVALMEGRGPFEWSKVGSDKPRHSVIDAVKGLHNETGAKLIFVSGRDESCREETWKWLKEVAGFTGPWPLFMRPKGDSRKDSIVKGEIFDREIRNVYDVVAVFDDRRQMVEHWRSIGLGDRLFDVGDGTEY